MKKIIFLLAFILSVFMASAEYEYVGDNDFYTGNTLFNSLISGVTYATKTINYPVTAPVSSDLDGDGLIEIIIMDGDFIKVYQNITLDPLSSISTGCDYDVWDSSVTQLWVQDINSDGLKEIMFKCTTSANANLIKIMNLTDGSLMSKHHTADSRLRSCASIGCTSDGNCLVTGCDKEGYDVNNGLIFQPFNISHAGGIVGLEGTGLRQLCIPRINTLDVEDIDADGNEETIFTIHHDDIGDDDKVWMYKIENTAPNTWAEEDFVEIDAYDTSNALQCWFYGTNDKLTSAMTFDTDTTVGTEIWVAVEVDSEEYKLYQYDETFNLIDDYPELTQADGRIMSNPFVADIISDSGYTDVCIFAYDDANNKIKMLCGSENSAFAEHEEYDYSTAGLFTLNDSIYHTDILTHTVQAVSDTTNGVNLYEIITPYGIFSVDEDWIFTGDLVLEYANPLNESATFVTMDIENNSRADILALTDTNFWYIDDGFVNGVGRIDEYTINPCFDSVWKQNTTVSVLFKVIDDESNTVCGRAFLYYGAEQSGNQQNCTETCGSSGTTFSCVFNAYNSTSNGVLRFEGKDTYNNDTWDTYSFPFSVSSNGVEYNDCTTTEEGLIEGEAVEEGLSENRTASVNNAITQEVQRSSARTGLGTSVTWLLFMIVGALVIWWLGAENNFTGKLISGMLSIWTVGLFIIGVKLQFFSSGLLWTIVILALVVIGALVSRFFLGERSGV